jgi:hypothetical protein
MSAAFYRCVSASLFDRLPRIVPSGGAVTRQPFLCHTIALPTLFRIYSSLIPFGETGNPG